MWLLFNKSEEIILQRASLQLSKENFQFWGSRTCHFCAYKHLWAKKLGG
jgi:hypothetical protein